jgi:hypothetical protein
VHHITQLQYPDIGLNTCAKYVIVTMSVHNRYMQPSDPFPRKLMTGKGAVETALQANFGQWHVDPYCARLWDANRLLQRKDTFIGLLDTTSWTLYIAPCFGVEPQEWQRKLRLPRDTPLTDLRTRFATLRDLPADLELVSGSTSVEADAARSMTLEEVRRTYALGACIVPWMDETKFDGHSHRVLALWVDNHPKINPKPAQFWQRQALGFAIQRDSLGYYVRFASGYNQWPWGAPQGSDTVNIRFEKRSLRATKAGYNERRELRDLPKEWAIKLVEILARDLHLGHFPVPSRLDFSEKYFEKLISRGESRFSKYKRLT